MNKRWGAALRYHRDYKWYWLNVAQTDDTKLTIETVHDVVFADIASVSH
jgi:hypothetical protein